MCNLMEQTVFMVGFILLGVVSEDWASNVFIPPRPGVCTQQETICITYLGSFLIKIVPRSRE